MARRRTDRDDASPPSPDPGGRTPADVDWESPRWREADAEQGDDERGRRLRGAGAPKQPGAIDDARSIDPAAGTQAGEPSDAT